MKFIYARCNFGKMGNYYISKQQTQVDLGLALKLTYLVIYSPVARDVRLETTTSDKVLFKKLLEFLLINFKVEVENVVDARKSKLLQKSKRIAQCCKSQSID